MIRALAVAAGVVGVAAMWVFVIGLCRAAAVGDRQLDAERAGPDGPRGLDLLADQPGEVVRLEQTDVDRRFHDMVAAERHPSTGGPQ